MTKQVHRKKKNTRTTTTLSRKKSRGASRSRRRGECKHKLRGGKVTLQLLHQILEESYKDNAQPTLVTGMGVYQLDAGLSTKLSKVYHNFESQHTIIAHRGTYKVTDWGNNLVYCVMGKIGYECTDRSEEAALVQHHAEQKYGVERLTTVGHSQGGLLAETLGKNGLEIITYNRPVRVGSNDDHPFQFNIRHPQDVVSLSVANALTNRRDTSWRDLTLRGAPNKSITTNHGLDMLSYGYDESPVGRSVPLPTLRTERRVASTHVADALSTRPSSSKYHQY